jgi:2Fe-2S ferredoxin
VPKVFFLTSEGVEHVVDGKPGDSVMATAVKNGVPGVLGQCGGTLSCATCHVFVEDAPDAPPMSDDEDDLLDGAATDRDETSRLSCQLVLVEGVELRVRVPATQL